MKNIINQTTAALLLSSLAFTSCSKNYSTTVYDSQSSGTNAEKVATTDKAQADYLAWKKLILSDEKNIALAEILSSTVASENRALVSGIVSSLTTAEVNDIITDVQKERNALGKSYLFRGNDYNQETELVRGSILNEGVSLSGTSFDSETTQLQIATFSYLKSKSLQEIYDSLNQAMDDSSKMIAQSMAVQIAQSEPQLASELEQAAAEASSKEDFSEKLKGSTAYLELADKTLRQSGLNTKEQLIVVSTGLIGGALYLELKDSKTFATLLAKYQEIKLKVEEVKKSIATINMAVAVISKNQNEAKASLDSFNKGLAGVQSGVKEAFDSAKSASESGDPVNGKKMAQFVYDKVIKGKDADESVSNASILSAQKKINDNIKQTSDAAAAMADNLSNIINAAHTISSTLGVTLPKDLEKALNTASKISAGVKLASTVVSGFMSGGVLSAVGLLGSSPVAGMLGLGGGPDKAVMAALGKINAKLDLVLDNQQKMMDIQIETIKMIKNLAVMIDEYHQKEMVAMAGLRDLSLVNLEIQKSVINQNIRTCEAMIDFKLKSYWGENNYIQKSKNGSTTTAIDFEKFYSQFDSLEKFRNFAKSSAENNFSKCQEAFSEAFGVDSTNENPILATYSTNGDNNLYTFQRNTYLPLVKLLTNWSGTNGSTNKILHIPMRQVSGMDIKDSALDRVDSSSASSVFSYNLENLLSSKSLERYLSSLLILYPVFEFDKGDWDKSLSDLVSSYYQNVSSDNVSSLSNDNTVSRGYYFMNNALDLIQSAIAQEALLAGEPIIPKMRSQIAKELFRNDQCTKVSSDLMNTKLKDAELDLGSERAVICSLRSNKLLMKNYLTYTAQKSISFALSLEKYKAAYEKKDFTTLALYFANEGISSSMFIANGDELSIRLPMDDEKIFADIVLPTMNQINLDVLVYSENMEHLLKMQKDTLSALIKLSPSQFRSTESREKYAEVLLLKNY